MGLSFNEQGRNYKRAVPTQSNVIKSDNANRLTHTNRAFLTAIGLKVKNNGKVTNIRGTTL